jgi:hypothetical protein
MGEIDMHAFPVLHTVQYNDSGETHPSHIYYGVNIFVCLAIYDFKLGLGNEIFIIQSSPGKSPKPTETSPPVKVDRQPQSMPNTTPYRTRDALHDKVKSTTPGTPT